LKIKMTLWPKAYMKMLKNIHRDLAMKTRVKNRVKLVNVKEEGMSPIIWEIYSRHLHFVITSRLCLRTLILIRLLRLGVLSNKKELLLCPGRTVVLWSIKMNFHQGLHLNHIDRDLAKKLSSCKVIRRYCMKVALLMSLHWFNTQLT
jgi:hypothetical protein